MAKKNEGKAKDSWGCKWLITVNAPTLTALFTTVKFSDLPCELVSYKIGYEIGSTGNLHKHLYLVFNRSWRKSSLINKFKGAQIDLVTQGTEQTVINYVGGAEKSEEKGSTVLWTEEWGNLDSSQGQRNDISATDGVLWQIKDAIDAGATQRDLWNNFFPYLVRYGAGIFRYRQEYNHTTSEKKEGIVYEKNVNEEY